MAKDMMKSSMMRPMMGSGNSPMKHKGGMFPKMGKASMNKTSTGQVSGDGMKSKMGNPRTRQVSDRFK